MSNTLRFPLVTTLAVALLPLLAACGGSSDKAASTESASGAGSTTKSANGATQLNIPDGTDAATKKKYIEENSLASCMKKQGFTYTPHVTTTTDDPSLNWDGEDYALAKKSRQKYGFGNYAAAVYPDDANAPHTNAGGKSRGRTLDHVDDDEKGLTPAQQKAYNIALSGSAPKINGAEKLGGCDEKAQTAAYGPPLSTAATKNQEAAKAEQNSAHGLALNGDAQLVQLAQQFATCLKAQGIKVTTTQPTGLANMVRMEQNVPENHFTMSKETALPLLTKEIDISLKDLECGKKFRAAYFPKEKAQPYTGEGAG